MPAIVELDRPAPQQPIEYVDDTASMLNTPDSIDDGLLIFGILVVTLGVLAVSVAKAYQLKKLIRLRKRSRNTPKRRRQFRLLVGFIIFVVLASEVSISHLLIN